MKATKPKTLIVYEDAREDLAQAARDMERLAEAAGAAVRLRTASTVTVSEVLASRLFVFGAHAPDSPSYAELRRLFRGINLAGRRAAFFGPPGSKGVAALKASLKDSDISLTGQDLDVGSGPAAVAAWFKTAMDF
ncbi:MAG TPA: hypothetical protein P5117_09125 [Spirochaetia bacterium]|nr:hypothetical protein [Spirochaetia bacterium]HRZ89629.1 hypothetical protein [Spirochaetia bacterium]